MRRLQYELNEKGYEMFDGNDPDFYINYREPGRTREYYNNAAVDMMHKIKVPEYVQMIHNNTINWIDIPAEYYNDVQRVVNMLI